MPELDDPQLTIENGVVITNAGSEFDAVAVAQIRPQLLEAIKGGDKDAVFDLSQTEFIDSSGMGLFIFCFKKLNPTGKRVGLIGLHGQPKSVIGLSQIDRTVQVHDTLEDFLSAEA